MIIKVTETCYIDTDKKAVFNGENKENLSPKVVALIERMVMNRERPVTNSELAEYMAKKENSVYVASADDSNVRRIIYQAIGKLVKVGISKDQSKKIIEWCPGNGYAIHALSVSTEISSESYAFLLNVGVPGDDLKDLIDLMLSQGFSGKMGRHSLMTLANNGNACAMFEVGEMFYYGYITANHQPNYEEACKWYEKAAESNHPGALWTIGYMIMNNIYPHVPEKEIDYRKAFDYINRAQKLGSPAALTSIGQMYEEGHFPDLKSKDGSKCLPVDMGKAEEYYKAADAQNYHYATNRLARYYERKGNYEQALNMYERSAAMIADGYTYNKLGLMCEKGIGCLPNPSKACEYYVMSVEGVFQNDVTGWGRYNAGRVYAGRISAQPMHYIDMNKGVDLICQSMELLSMTEWDQPLCELLKILIDCDMSLMPQQIRDIEMLRLRVSRNVETYLQALRENVQYSMNVERVNELYATMSQYVQIRRS